MGFLDRFKKAAPGGIDKAADLVADHADKVDEGIDKVADVVDDKTGHKHTDKIDKAADAARGVVDKAEQRSKGKGGKGGKGRR